MRDFIIGVTAGFVTHQLGYYMGKRHRPRPIVKDQSICSCNHKYSVHKDDGKCNVVEIRHVNRRDNEYRCACVRYDGVPPAHLFMKDL